MKTLILLILCFILPLTGVLVFAQETTISAIPKKIEIELKQIEDKQAQKNTLDSIKDWLIPISTFISLITISIGAYQSLKEYKLKLITETRLTNSTQVETDIKLMKGFTDLLALAHSRKGSYLSEKTVEKMFEKDLFTDEELKDPDKLNRKLEKVAVLNVFSGVAEQNAFIAAITNLGLRHDILKLPVIQALETMKTFIDPELIDKYLELVKKQS